MRVIANRALTWVITAPRPLSSTELSIAVAIEPTHTCLEDLVICIPQAVVDICCGLLVEVADGVRPIHFTMQGFLETDDRGIGSTVKANAALAQSSIRYILFFDFSLIKGYSKVGSDKAHSDKDREPFTENQPRGRRDVLYMALLGSPCSCHR